MPKSSSKTPDHLINLFYLYRQYPYQMHHGPDNKDYYVPKKDHTNHRFSITYKEWRKVIMMYFRFLIKILISGETYHNDFGNITMVRYRPGKNCPDYGRKRKELIEAGMSHEKATKSLAYVRIPRRRGIGLNGWNLAISWERDFLGHSLLNVWMLRLSRTLFKEILNHFRENSNEVYTLMISKWKQSA